MSGLQSLPWQRRPELATGKLSVHGKYRVARPGQRQGQRPRPAELVFLHLHVGPLQAQTPGLKPALAPRLQSAQCHNTLLSEAEACLGWVLALQVHIHIEEPLQAFQGWLTERCHRRQRKTGQLDMARDSRDPGKPATPRPPPPAPRR